MAVILSKLLHFITYGSGAWYAARIGFGATFIFAVYKMISQKMFKVQSWLYSQMIPNSALILDYSEQSYAN
jgi:hypothetical protein